MQFKDKVSDAVIEADGIVESNLESTQGYQEQVGLQLVLNESQDVPGTDLDKDLESIEHATHMLIISQQTNANQTAQPLVIVDCYCVHNTTVPVFVCFGFWLRGQQTTVVKQLFGMVVKPYAKAFELPS